MGIPNRSNHPNRTVRTSPKELWNDDVTGAPEPHELAEESREGRLWTAYGPNHPEETHMMTDGVPARIDFPVKELERLASIGRPTPVSGNNLKKFGNKRYHELDSLDSIEIPLHDKDELWNKELNYAREMFHKPDLEYTPEQAAHGHVNAQLEFHDSLHSSTGTTCDRSTNGVCSAKWAESK